MPVPTFTSVTFTGSLHKKKHKPANSLTIHGCANISPGDEVNVNGTRGQRTTTWSGTIHSNLGGGNFDVVDLRVDTAEVSLSGGHRGGSEDVSVTVTNATDTSDPVTTPAVPTVP
jgi:hypothetical protein